MSDEKTDSGEPSPDVRMTFAEYMERATETRIYPHTIVNSAARERTWTVEAPWLYPALGVAAEAGELANKLSKALRDDFGVVTAARLGEVKKEVGGVLWQLTMLCTELGFTLEEAARLNLAQLASRAARGVLSGSGDDR